jgi:hypothetical protein
MRNGWWSVGRLLVTGVRVPAGALVGVGVPPPFRPALQLLAKVSQDVADAVHAALADAPEFRTVAQLQDLMPSAITSAPGGEALVPCLLSLASHAQAGHPAALAKAISRSPGLELDEAQAGYLEHRLTQLLSTPALESTGHAIEILTQNPRNYGASHVFTDVRHVFRRDATQSPTGATIVEVLQLQTWSPDGSSDTIYVAMDEVDLKELQEVVDRALKKTSTLRQMLQQQQLTYFQLDPTDDAPEGT